MSIKAQKEKGRAPYTKFGKIPYRYSDQYQNWRTAVVAGRDGDARHWAREHAKRFESRWPRGEAAT